MAILADVAPYSREYHTYRQKVGKQAQGDTELEIEYERILTRVKKTRSFRPALPKNPRTRASDRSPSMIPASLRPGFLALFRYGKLEWIFRPALLLARTPDTGSAHRSFASLNTGSSPLGHSRWFAGHGYRGSAGWDGTGSF